MQKELHTTITYFRQEVNKGFNEMKDLILGETFRNEVLEPALVTYSMAERFIQHHDNITLQALKKGCENDDPISTFVKLEDKVEDIYTRAETYTFEREKIEKIEFSYYSVLLTFNFNMAFCTSAKLGEEMLPELLKMANSTDASNSSTTIDLTDFIKQKMGTDTDASNQTNEIIAAIEAVDKRIKDEYFPNYAMKMIMEQVLKESAGIDNGKIAEQIGELMEKNFPWHNYFVGVYDYARGWSEHALYWPNNISAYHAIQRDDTPGAKKYYYDKDLFILRLELNRTFSHCYYDAAMEELKRVHVHGCVDDLQKPLHPLINSDKCEGEFLFAAIVRSEKYHLSVSYLPSLTEDDQLIGKIKIEWDPDPLSLLIPEKEWITTRCHDEYTFIQLQYVK